MLSPTITLYRTTRLCPEALDIVLLEELLARLLGREEELVVDEQVLTESILFDGFVFDLPSSVVFLVLLLNSLRFSEIIS